MVVCWGDVLEVDAAAILKYSGQRFRGAASRFKLRRNSSPFVRRAVPQALMASGLTAFLDADLLGFGTFDLTPWGEALIAQHAQGLDFRPLAAAFAVFEDFEVARTGHAIVINCFFLLWYRSPEHQQLADMLNRCGAEFIGQGLKHGFAGSAIIRENTDLDESVRVQGGIGFFFDRGGEPVTTNHDHRVKVMRFGAVFFALGGGQLNLRHIYIIGEEGQNEIPN